MFPNEIYENILLYVTDLKTICNCRLVCYDWKEMMYGTVTKITKNYNSEEKSIKPEFIQNFPKIKHLHVPVNIKIFPKNIQDFLSALKTITLENLDILENISWLEEMVLSSKTIKIYNKNSVYWCKRGFYGKYEKYMNEFNEIDGQLMDLCRCETLISNKKPYHYFPVKNFIYISSLNDLTCFDYIPFLNIKSYSWQPIKAEDRRKIDFRKKITNLSSSLSYIKNVYPDIKKFEVPFLERDISQLKTNFPNSESFAILRGSDLHFADKIINLSAPLPTGEEYIDSFLS